MSDIELVKDVKIFAVLLSSITVHDGSMIGP